MNFVFLIIYSYLSGFLSKNIFASIPLLEWVAELMQIENQNWLAIMVAIPPSIIHLIRLLIL
jgi:hypothetical protein